MSDKKRKRSQWGLRDLSALKILNLVGDGTYGMVFSGQDKENGEMVALKKIKMEKETQGFPVTAIREIKILKALRHENIVELKEMVTYEKESAEIDSALINMKVQLFVGDVFMVFEYAEYDLAGLINSSEVTFTDNHIKSYAKQLLDGIHFMHRNRILHRDIKGANILVTVDNKIKIADLGLARSYVSTEEKFTSNNKVVTRWYRSPELILETKKYGPEIDIWSIGCLCAELKERMAIMQGTSDLHQLELIYTLCGTPVMNASNSSVDPAVINMADTSTHSTSVLDGTVYNVYKELPGFDRYPIANTYPPNLRNRFQKYDASFVNLLSQMLMMHPKQRIGAADALNHDYFWENEIPKPEQLPKFLNIHSGHEYEARMRRNAEMLARQKEHAAYLAKQSQHFQPQYDRNAPGAHAHRGTGNTQPPPPPMPGLHPPTSSTSGGTAAHGNITNRALSTGSAAGTQSHASAHKGMRSSQGLTKGFSVVRPNAAANPSTSQSSSSVPAPPSSAPQP